MKNSTKTLTPWQDWATGLPFTDSRRESLTLKDAAGDFKSDTVVCHCSYKAVTQRSYIIITAGFSQTPCQRQYNDELDGLNFLGLDNS